MSQAEALLLLPVVPLSLPEKQRVSLWLRLSLLSRIEARLKAALESLAEEQKYRSTQVCQGLHH
jgi:hypothetical protein